MDFPLPGHSRTWLRPNHNFSSIHFVNGHHLAYHGHVETKVALFSWRVKAMSIESVFSPSQTACTRRGETFNLESVLKPVLFDPVTLYRSRMGLPGLKLIRRKGTA